MTASSPTASAAPSAPPSGHHSFDRLCAQPRIEHRLIAPGRPQTKGMVERFIGRIGEVPVTTRFDSSQSLAETIKRYVRNL